MHAWLHRKKGAALTSDAQFEQYNFLSKLYITLLEREVSLKTKVVVSIHVERVADDACFAVFVDYVLFLH